MRRRLEGGGCSNVVLGRISGQNIWTKYPDEISGGCQMRRRLEEGGRVL